MSTMTSETTAGRRRPDIRRGGAGHPGPPLAAPLIAFVVTFAASIFVGPISGAGTVPSPFDSPGTVDAYFAEHATVTSVSAWLMLLSAVALAVFAAVAYSRLTFLAPNAPGPAIAGVGGLAAALLLAISAASTWMLSAPAVADQAGLASVLHHLSFVTGGPAHTALLGVLVLGLAVTTIFVRRTPRALSIVGLVIAAVDVLGTASMLTESLTPLVPVGRFASLIWLVAISLLVPRERAARGR